jgi:hypothetical protein
MVNFIVGYPGESTSDFLDTLTFISEDDHFLISPQVYQIRHFWTDDPRSLSPYGLVAKRCTLNDIRGNEFQFVFLGPEVQLSPTEQNTIRDRMRNIWDVANQRAKSLVELEDLVAVPFLDKERMKLHMVSRLSSPGVLIGASGLDAQTISGLTEFERSLVEYTSNGRSLKEILEWCSEKINPEGLAAFSDEGGTVAVSSVLRLIGLGTLGITQE